MTSTQRDTGLNLQAWGVTIPMSLCPMALSKNARVHWAVRARAFRDQKEWVEWRWREDEMPWSYNTIADPWPAAIIDVFWNYSRGKQPDDVNVWARVDPARDAFEAIGLVADDMHIRTGRVTFTKVKRGEESVTVSLRRDEGEQE
jgi:hypothetical protein